MYCENVGRSQFYIWTNFTNYFCIIFDFYEAFIYTLSLYQNNCITTKALTLAKKMKNMLTSKIIKNKINNSPTEHKDKVSRPATLKIIRTKHQNRAWLSLIYYIILYI